MSKALAETNQSSFRKAHLVKQIIQTLDKEAEKANARILICFKKKSMTMREFYSRWDNLQSMLMKDKDVEKAENVGPVWTITVRMPIALQPVQDRLKAVLGGDVAALRGKSDITKLRDKTIQWCYSAMEQILGVGKGNGKASGFQTYWPEAKTGTFSICAQGSEVVRGFNHLNDMRTEVAISRKLLGDQRAAALCAATLGKEEERHVGSFLKTHVEPVPEQVGEPWGRGKGKGKGKPFSSAPRPTTLFAPATTPSLFAFASSNISTSTPKAAAEGGTVTAGTASFAPPSNFTSAGQGIAEPAADWQMVNNDIVKEAEKAVALASAAERNIRMQQLTQAKLDAEHTNAEQKMKQLEAEAVEAEAKAKKVSAEARAAEAAAQEAREAKAAAEVVAS